VIIGLVITTIDRVGSRAEPGSASAGLNATDFITEIVLIVVFGTLVFRALSRPVPATPARGAGIWMSVWIIGALASIALLTLRVERAVSQSPGRLRKARAAAQAAARRTASIERLAAAVTSQAEKVKATHAHSIVTGPASTGETLTHNHVREYREAIRRWVDVTDELINECTLAEALKLDSSALGVDVGLFRNYFVVLQRWTRAVLQKSTIIDEHWEAWQTHGVQAENGSYTPWQKELLRLEDVAKTAQTDLATAEGKLRRSSVQK
jgi:hypothetical protein